MMMPRDLPIADIYVPVDRRKELDPERVEQRVQDLLDGHEPRPIQVREDVRKDGVRYVLIKGIHRLEAHKAVGDETIAAFIVSARRH